MTNEAKRLVESLREHAEWAKGNEWETPITLSDDLSNAADLIEKLIGRLSSADGLIDELKDHLDEWHDIATRAKKEMDELFYEAIRLKRKK